MAPYRQLRALLWKQVLVRKRRALRTLTLLCVPLSLLMLVLVLYKRHHEQLIKTYKFVTYEPDEDYLSPWGSTKYRPDLVAFSGRSPGTARVVNIFESLAENYSAFHKVNSTLFKTYKDSRKHGTSMNKLNIIYIKFNNISEVDSVLPKHLDYTIVSSHLQIGHYKEAGSSETYVSRDKAFNPDFYRNDVLLLQRLIAQSVERYWLERQGRLDVAFDGQIIMLKMPHELYTEDHTSHRYLWALKAAIVLVYLIPFLGSALDLVREKETHVKELFLLAGVSRSTYWLSWLLPEFAVMISTSAIVSAKIIWADITRDAFIPLLRVLFMVSMLIITMGFLTCMLMKKASAWSALFLLVLYIAGDYSAAEDFYPLQDFQELWFGAVLTLEGQLIGSSTTPDDSQHEEYVRITTPFGRVLLIVTQGIIYCVLIVYVDSITNGKPYNFFVKKEFWFPKKSDPSTMDESIVHAGESEFFEKDQSGAGADIYVDKLSKTHGTVTRGKRSAVTLACLKIYRNQVTVLLGHMGSGKSTFVQMLTGFVPPSNGTAIVNGWDITNISGRREGVGYAPKQPILINLLTVQEHLTLFNKIRSDDGTIRVKPDVVEIAREVNLLTKIRAKVSELNASQKKRLSVGIALTMGTKSVFLEEPTEGLDPASQRKIRCGVQRAAESRTVVVTTTQKDEADILGERIIIMADGFVKCYGSALFLKNLCGAGSRLVITTQPDYDVGNLLRVVQSHANVAVLDSIVSSEISFQLLDEHTEYKQLFQELAHNMYKLGIIKYTVRSTAMEELFNQTSDSGTDLETSSLTISRKAATSKQSLTQQVSPSFEDLRGSEISNWIPMTNFTKETGLTLLKNQFRAVFVKRALMAWRYRDLSFIQSFFMLCFVILAAGNLNSHEELGQRPEVYLRPDVYDPNDILYTYPDTDQDERFVEFYEELLGNSSTTLTRVNVENRSLIDYHNGLWVEHGIGTDRHFYHNHYMGFQVNPKDYALELSGKETGKRPLMVVLYNALAAPKSQLISANLLYNAIIRNSTNESDISVTIKLRNHKESDEDDLIVGFLTRVSVSAHTFGTIYLTGLSALPFLAMFVLIKERRDGGKRMHFVSGMSPALYWSSNLAWDVLTAFVPGLLTLPILALFHGWVFIGDGRWATCLLVLLCHAWATFTMTYALQLFFRSSSVGVTFLIVVSRVCYVLYRRFEISRTYVFLGRYKLDLRAELQSGEEKFKPLIYSLRTISPDFNTVRCLEQMFINYHRNKQCRGKNCAISHNVCCDEPCTTLPCMFKPSGDMAWAFPGMGSFLVNLLLQGCVATLIIALVETRIARKLWVKIVHGCSSDAKIHPEQSAMFFGMADNSIQWERERIEALSYKEIVSDDREDDIVLVNLQLLAGTEVAVDRMCVSVPQNGCLALLGNMGVWRGLLLRMLTGEVEPTSGTAYVRGLDVRENAREIRDSIGYCPGKDYHPLVLTGREILTMYGLIRGIPADRIPGMADAVLSVLAMEKRADDLVMNYSTSTSRKLSIAVALMGKPSVLLMDEPTSDMDFVSQRKLWHLLLEARKHGTTIMMTSHRLEECEVLCSKIALANRGTLECVGSRGYLRNRFNRGYLVVVRMMRRQTMDFKILAPFISDIKERFANVRVLSQQPGVGHFHVLDEDVTIEDIVFFMESVKDKDNVADYTANAMTVERLVQAVTRQSYSLNAAGEDMSVYPLITFEKDEEF